MLAKVLQWQHDLIPSVAQDNQCQARRDVTILLEIISQSSRDGNGQNKKSTGRLTLRVGLVDGQR